MYYLTGHKPDACHSKPKPRCWLLCTLETLRKKRFLVSSSYLKSPTVLSPWTSCCMNLSMTGWVLLITYYFVNCYLPVSCNLLLSALLSGLSHNPGWSFFRSVGWQNQFHLYSSFVPQPSTPPCCRNQSADILRRWMLTCPVWVLWTLGHGPLASSSIQWE